MSIDPLCPQWTVGPVHSGQPAPSTMDCPQWTTRPHPLHSNVSRRPASCNQVAPELSHVVGSVASQVTSVTRQRDTHIGAYGYGPAYGQAGTQGPPGQAHRAGTQGRQRTGPLGTLRGTLPARGPVRVGVHRPRRRALCQGPYSGPCVRGPWAYKRAPPGDARGSPVIAVMGCLADKVQAEKSRKQFDGHQVALPVGVRHGSEVIAALA